MKKPNDILKELEKLQNNIKECTDDKKAIALQKQIIDTLSTILKDQDMIKEIVKNQQKK